MGYDAYGMDITSRPALPARDRGRYASLLDATGLLHARTASHGGCVGWTVDCTPMRRVFSLEESSQRPRSLSLRQRSSGSILAPSSSLTIPNAAAEKESIATTASPHPSPPVLRRVVSDLTRTPPLPLTRESSFGRRFPNPFRPRAQPYHSFLPIHLPRGRATVTARQSERHQSRQQGRRW